MIALRKLACNKSHGLNTSMNEYFIEFKDLLLPFVLQIFNSSSEGTSCEIIRSSSKYQDQRLFNDPRGLFESFHVL